PANFAGTFSTTTAALSGGPVNLVAPTISGTPGVGAQLAATPGLWIYDTGSSIAESWQWLRGGAEIPGANSAMYTMTASDVGQGVSIREIATDGLGQRFADSAAVSQFFTPSSDTALLGWWDATDSATITTNGGLVSAWADKAGGSALVQPAGIQQPTTGTRSLNGQNVLDFNGNQFMQRNETLPASGNVAFHLVFEVDAINNAFEAILAVDATNDFQIDADNTTQFDGRLNVAGIGSSVSLSGGPFTGGVILSVIFDRTGAGVAEIYAGNALRGTMAYTTSIDQFSDLLLMTNRSKNAWVNGAIAELVITGDVANRASYQSYLSTKWGIV
ncbi:unnamed protein product, partial [Ectocarpus sp. 12 AP-2014]